MRIDKRHCKLLIIKLIEGVCKVIDLKLGDKSIKNLIGLKLSMIFIIIDKKYKSINFNFLLKVTNLLTNKILSNQFITERFTPNKILKLLNT